MISKIKVHFNSLYRLDIKVSLSLLFTIFLYKIINIKFFRLFTTKKTLIELKKRDEISEYLFSNVRKLENVYSTAYFFKGICIGAPWLISHGYGRWKFILEKNIEKIINKKNILDLGSNSGILPLYMLHSGAKSVTAVELLDTNISLIECYKTVFEKIQNKEFKLNIHKSDMMDIINFDPSKYDLVTAFCSLYYLTKNDLMILMEWVFKNIGIIIVEANNDSSVDIRDEKAKLSYLRKVAEEIGFIIIKEVRPKNYYRPIFIACAPEKIESLN